MRTKLFYVPIVMALMSAALLITNSRFKLSTHPKTTAYVPDAAIDEVWPTTSWTTQGPGIDLKGKMFTLSANGGGIRFYPPRYNTNTPDPWSSPTPYKTSTRPYTSTGPYSTNRPDTSTGPYSTNRPDTSTGPYSTNRPETSTGPYSTNRPDTSTGPYSTHPPYTTTRYPWTTAPPFRGEYVENYTTR
nr:protein kintoun-like [Labrus bergylta]